MVTPEQYKAELAKLQTAGNTGQLPIGCGTNSGVGKQGIPCRVGPVTGPKGQNANGGTVW